MWFKERAFDSGFEILSRLEHNEPNGIVLDQFFVLKCGGVAHGYGFIVLCIHQVMLASRRLLDEDLSPTWFM